MLLQKEELLQTRIIAWKIETTHIQEELTMFEIKTVQCEECTMYYVLLLQIELIVFCCC